MKKLTLENAVDFTKLLEKAGMKTTLKELFEKGKEEGADQEALGEMLLVEIGFIATKEGVDNDLYKLLANICEKTPEEIRNTSLDELEDIVKEIVANNNIVSFFKRAVKLLK